MGETPRGNNRHVWPIYSHSILCHSNIHVYCFNGRVMSDKKLTAERWNNLCLMSRVYGEDVAEQMLDDGYEIFDGDDDNEYDRFCRKYCPSESCP